MKVAYYSPLPPSRSGIADYSALLLPALRERIDVELARARALPPRAEGGRRPLPRRQRPGGARLDRRGAAPPPRRRRAPRARPPPPRRRASRSPAATRPATSPRWSATHGLAGRLLAYGVLDNRIPPLWETRPQDFPLAGEILRLAQRPRRPLAVRGGRCARGRLRGPGRAHPAPGVAARSRRRPPKAPLIGCFGHLNESKRIPQLLRGVRAAPRAASRARGCSSSAAPRAGSPISRRPRDVHARGLRRRGAALVADGRPATSSSRCARRRWARRRAPSSARCRSASRSSSPTSAGSPSCPTTVAVKVAPDEREVETLAAELERLLERRRGARMRWAPPRYELARTSTPLERVADLYAAALEEAAGRRGCPGRRDA